jgi:hypothetical protein
VNQLTAQGEPAVHRVGRIFDLALEVDLAKASGKDRDADAISSMIGILMLVLMKDCFSYLQITAGGIAGKTILEASDRSILTGYACPWHRLFSFFSKLVERFLVILYRSGPLVQNCGPPR